MLPFTRIVVAVAAVLLLLSGLVAFAGAHQIVGLWPMVIGALGIVALAFERSRYRSEAAERMTRETGPGGGEPAPPGPPFTLTDERFVDPSSGRQMRVYVDPGSGERRYHAEG
jgi:hypothetical protein